jgi:hypothetical protein
MAGAGFRQALSMKASTVEIMPDLGSTENSKGMVMPRSVGPNSNVVLWNLCKVFIWNMDWIRTFVCLFFFGTLFLQQTKGQSFETGLNYYPGIAHSEGFEIGSNGFSLDVSYLHELPYGFSARGGMEFGVSGWGSQILIPLGARFGKDHQVDLELLNGTALYRQEGAYVVGGSVYYVYTLFRNQKHRLVLSAGIRYTIQPSYRKYSNLNAYLDLPVGIRWQFGQTAASRD